ncbi:phosphotransferase enzyme family protein [Paenibacillus agri]|uniref:Phosphotransferase n=1 Tax=Paenibacillus agri TaxID=2744309 RepID=A0A850EPB3_9BACL|nr:phosphotransferase [Paenibacillus agri]NUU60462.1 phosphotransferase [Paenibacillus agri]
MIKISNHSLDAMAKKFGTHMDALTFVGGGGEESDGILYSYRSGCRDMVLKILAISKGNADRAFKEMDERTRFINYLGRHGMDIAYPVLNTNNNIIETLDTGDYILVAYTMDRIRGRVPGGNDYTKDFHIRYGALIGKLHRLTKNYPTWTGSAPDGGSDVLNWEGEWSFFYSWCKDAEIKQAWKSLKSELSELPVTRDTFGFIHNDPHINNIMLEHDRMVLIDFDVANYHWFANDIAIASQFLLFSTAGGMNEPFKDMDGLKFFYTHFMNGYEMENHLDTLFLNKLELFINYRRLLMYTVSQSWLESNPEDKKSWKRMILNSPELHLFN